jgi:negative regulator of replication initiation
LKIKALYLFQNARKGGGVNPAMEKFSPSLDQYCSSQCFAFQRANNSFNRFMSGLRGLFRVEAKSYHGCAGHL